MAWSGKVQWIQCVLCGLYAPLRRNEWLGGCFSMREIYLYLKNCFLILYSFVKEQRYFYILYILHKGILNTPLCILLLLYCFKIMNVNLFLPLVLPPPHVFHDCLNPFTFRTGERYRECIKLFSLRAVCENKILYKDILVGFF